MRKSHRNINVKYGILTLQNLRVGDVHAYLKWCCKKEAKKVDVVSVLCLQKLQKTKQRKKFEKC